MEAGANSLTVRPYSSEDFEDVKALHAKQDLDYEFPDLSTPLMPIKLAVVDGKGKVVGAAFVRLTAELIGILDPEMELDKRREVFTTGMKAAEKASEEFGIDELHIWIPNKLNGLGRLMGKFGYVPDGAKSFFKQMVNNNGKNSAA